MTLELTRIAPLRAANVIGALHFIMFGVFGLLMAPVFSSIPSGPNVDHENMKAFQSVFRWMAIVYPIFGGIMGWLLGLFGTAIYNLIAPGIGGFSLEFTESSARNAPVA